MNRRILLADDDDDDHLIFTDAIKEIDPGFICDTVYNGIKALEILYKKTPLPDVVFIDINMPLLNGFECLSEIKKTEELAGIPVIIFSTTANQAAIETARILGARLFISKPADHKELSQKLSKAFEILFPDPSKGNRHSPSEFYI